MITFYSQEDLNALDTVSTLEEAGALALAILKRMSEEDKEIIQLCGPMSTGGLGNLEDNMKRFQSAINIAYNKGLLVFDQIPFQSSIIRLTKFKEGEPIYNMDILEIFYRTIFESGYIKKALFLPGWESSKGARWERELVTQLGIPVEEYPPEWLENLEDNEFRKLD